MDRKEFDKKFESCLKGFEWADKMPSVASVIKNRYIVATGQCAACLTEDSDSNTIEQLRGEKITEQTFHAWFGAEGHKEMLPEKYLSFSAGVLLGRLGKAFDFDCKRDVEVDYVETGKSYLMRVKRGNMTFIVMLCDGKAFIPQWAHRTVEEKEQARIEREKFEARMREIEEQ